MSRYNRRQTAINSNEMYEDHFEVRDIKRINQYRTPIFRYPTDAENYTITFIDHYWSLNDKYYKLASKYYGDSKLWWIIAQYNNAPTEQHLTEGQLIKVPFPLHTVINYLGQE
jgi:hypothetical protein